MDRLACSHNFVHLYVCTTGSPASSDIQPTMGSVFFTSGSTSREFIVSVLPDAVPEITEVCVCVCVCVSITQMVEKDQKRKKSAWYMCMFRDHAGLCHAGPCHAGPCHASPCHASPCHKAEKDAHTYIAYFHHGNDSYVKFTLLFFWFSLLPSFSFLSPSPHFLSSLFSLSFSIPFTPSPFSSSTHHLPKVFNVTLINATGGARIGQQSSVQIRILPNDRPYGDVSLAMDVYTVTEKEDDQEFNFTVVRRYVAYAPE